MPSFEIPDGPTSVPLKTEGGFHNGTAVFNVTNRTGEGLTARFSVQVQGSGKAEWYSVQGEPERPVAAGETQTVTVVAKIPAPAPAVAPAPAPAVQTPPAALGKAPASAAPPPGQHRIKLRVTNVNDPDNDSTESTAATVTIPAAPKPAGKKSFPMWIIAVIAGVLVLVIGVIIAVVMMSGKKEPEAPPGTPVPKVTGLEYPAAVVELEKAGFKAAPAINEVVEGQPLGLVFKQDPEADAKVDPKAADVKLTVAIGATAIVPAVVDKQYIAAQALIEDRGFTVGPAVAGAASGKTPNTVLTQDPVGEASAPKGSAVTLTVDPGVVVPDLLNPQVDGIAGIKSLQAAGLSIGKIDPSCKGAADKIISQSIDPKTRVAKGTPVNIVIGPSATGLRSCFVLQKDVLSAATKARSSSVIVTPGISSRLQQPK